MAQHVAAAPAAATAEIPQIRSMVQHAAAAPSAPPLAAAAAEILQI